jgi:NitT/TauT family transport system substrate-binding protein
MESVRLVLPFRPDIQFAPFYVAMEKGYFEAQRLEITFEHLPENEAVALVGASEAPFAIVSGEQVLLARAQGLPVVYVMAWWEDYPVAVAVPEGTGVEGPGDLAGLKIGIPGLYGASYIGYRALIGSAGLPESAATLESIGYNQVEALLTGQVDAAVVYANNEPIQLRAQGLPVEVLSVADHVPLASNGLITHESMLETAPEQIRRMNTALWRGIDDVASDPAEAYEISKRYVEGLEQADERVMRAVLEKSILFWQTERPGYSSPEAWENMHQVLLEMGLLESPLQVESAYTNEFTPAP